MHSVIDYRIPFQHVVVGSTWIDINFSLVNFFFLFQIKTGKVTKQVKNKKAKMSLKKKDGRKRDSSSNDSENEEDCAADQCLKVS